MTAKSLPQNKKFAYPLKREGHLSWTSSLPILPSSLFLSDVRTIRKIFKFFFHSDLPRFSKEEFSNWLEAHLPMMAWKGDSFPGSLSIFFLTKTTPHKRAEAILFDELRQFLLKNRNVQLTKLCHLNFCLSPLPKKHFTAGEIQLLVEQPHTQKGVEQALFYLKEACLKNFRSSDNPCDRSKLSYLESTLKHYRTRFPDQFDDHLLDLFSKLSALTTKQFKKRLSSHLVLSLYLVEKRLIDHLKAFPNAKTTVKVRPFSIKRTLIGVAIAIELTPKYDHLGEDELLQAAKQCLQRPQIVDDSFYRGARHCESIHTFYLELKKEGNLPFSRREITLFKEKFRAEIIKRIEHLSPLIFGQCIEEEIMKNSALLMREVKSNPSCPQVMIFFDKLTRGKLFFKVLLACKKKQRSESIKKQLEVIDPSLLFIPDQEKTIGSIEIHIFRLAFSQITAFLRTDQSINLLLARRKVTALLEAWLGEIRDYNGGLLVKKEENLIALKKAFPSVDQDLIENFFYALQPVTEQATLSVTTLCSFFSYFLRCKANKDSLDFSKSDNRLYAHLKSDDLDAELFFKQQLESFDNLTTTFLPFGGTHHLAFLFLSQDQKTRRRFKERLRAVFAKWNKKETLLRISSTSQSPLDPRRGGDQSTTTLLRLVFEGLTRFDHRGKIALAIAKSCTLSTDKKRYCFNLRKSYWSNGDSLTAEDFEYAWKSALEPHFPVDFPELFYCIKHAEEVKRGELPLSEVGIKAKDKRTLIIDLETPTPDFLERLAHTLFLPVPSRLVKQDPHWAHKRGKAFVGNGPYSLENPKTGCLLNLTKNDHSLRKKTIQIDRISIACATLAEALRLFKQGHLDFLEVQNHLEEEMKIGAISSLSFPDKSTLWFSINTTSFPLNNLFLRKALAASLDREKIKPLFLCKKESALTLLPSELTQLKTSSPFERYNPERARIYFKAALLELRLKQSTLPPISLMVPANRLRKSIAQNLKAQWEKELGISCLIEAYPWPEFYQRRIEKRFKLAMVNWGAPTSDPITTLSAFKTKTDKLNLSNWESPPYKKLLETAQKETNQEKRKLYAIELEKILLKEVCVLPLFYGRRLLFHRPNLKLSLVTPTSNGMPDFSLFSFKNKGSS